MQRRCCQYGRTNTRTKRISNGQDCWDWPWPWSWLLRQTYYYYYYYYYYYSDCDGDCGDVYDNHESRFTIVGGSQFVDGDDQARERQNRYRNILLSSCRKEKAKHCLIKVDKIFYYNNYRQLFYFILLTPLTICRVVHGVLGILGRI